MNAIKSKLRKNEKILISNAVEGLDTGVYFCDIYTFKSKKTLPPNSFVRVDDPNPVRYNDLTSFNLGITVAQNIGHAVNERLVNTTTIVVKYSIKGEIIDKVLPTSLIIGFKYTYYYTSL